MDDLLTNWLQASDDAQAELRLMSLIADEIEPLMVGVIRFKLRLNHEAPEAEDLKQEALTELLNELQKCRQQPDTYAIADIRALAATITYRTCYRWLRSQTPQRNALRNRLHYVLTRKPHLALWPMVNNKLSRWLSGLAEWRGRHDCASATELQRLRETDTLLRWNGRGQGDVAEFSNFLTALFNAAGLPIEMDELVRLAATLLQIRDEASVSATTEEGGELSSLVAHDDIAWQVEKRIFLQRLWDELLLLPVPQRTALLLNLRDANGHGCIALFPVVGVAGLPQLAAALEVPLERLAELWNQLPLDDTAIGEWLNVTRQQVINLRKSARERLARRLKGFF
jgi:RNA polymerase sigma factor (sigma-70 family)